MISIYQWIVDHYSLIIFTFGVSTYLVISQAITENKQAKSRLAEYIEKASKD